MTPSQKRRNLLAAMAVKKRLSARRGRLRLSDSEEEEEEEENGDGNVADDRNSVEQIFLVQGIERFTSFLISF